MNKKIKNGRNELKASHTLYHVKEYFYKHIEESNDWKIYSIILNKAAIYNKMHEKAQPKNLYNLLSRKILEKVKFNDE